MAKIVIAGKANCPYFAKVELLADALAKNLPSFDVHKILILPEDWEEWLKKTCEERNWTHSESPLVWRELVDRGGKGLYMGGGNELQEYAKIYYNLTSSMISDLQLSIAEENLQTKKEVDEEVREMWVVNNSIKVCISSAHHPTCYNLVHHLATGDVFGQDVQIYLRLLTNEENEEEIKGMEMEITDLGLPLVRETTVTTSARDALRASQLIIFLDEVAKNEGESDTSWLKKNSELFENYGQLINEYADKDARIVVAGDGPVNFNTNILIKNASKISPSNIVAVSRTLENRAKAILAKKLAVNSAEVVDVVVWGDPSTSHFVDVSNARVHNYDGAIWGPPFYSRHCVEMVHDNKWLSTEFLQELQQRKQTTESMLKHKTAMSQAATIQTLVKHWWNGSPEDQVFSLGVRTDGSAYDIPSDLVFSLPVKFSAGSWQVVDNLTLDDETKQKIKDVVQSMRKDLESTDDNPRAASAAQSKPATPVNVEQATEVPEEQNENSQNNNAASATDMEEITTNEEPSLNPDNLEETEPASNPDNLEEIEPSSNPDNLDDPEQ